MTRQEILERLAEHRGILTETERALRYDFEETVEPHLQKEELAHFSTLLLVATKTASLASLIFLKALSIADTLDQERRTSETTK